MSADLTVLQTNFNALMARGALEEAEALVRPFTATGRAPIPIWQMLAQTIRRQGRIAETRIIQDMLVMTLPGDLPGRFDLSETLLLLGEFDRGWREYRFRYDLAHTTRIARKVQRPAWQGDAIPGKALLIHDEQGYGDSFQFLRLVHMARARSQARIVLEVNAETMALAQRGLGGVVDDFVARGSLPPAFDTHCQLMSLPAALGLQLTDLPGPLPYLLPDPSKLQRWRGRLADLPRPLVALTWAGRPTHSNDANRSMTLAGLAPLAMPGVHFIAIQKGPAAEQGRVPPPGMALTVLDQEIENFDDTAAILSVADLLISVDSSPVHLAGSLGRPAWVMLPFVPDWRWLMDRPDSPWYPQHRLYRQNRTGEWSAPLAAIARDLAALRDRAVTT